MLEEIIEKSVPMWKVAEGCAVVIFTAVAIAAKGYTSDLWFPVAMYACALCGEICARATKESEESR